jgi:hypothetical protein
MKTVYIFVSGILTVPGRVENWTGKAATWVNLYTAAKGENIDYLTGVRRQGELEHVERLTVVMDQYYANSWDIVLTGHSNGCDVILDSLVEQNWPPVKALHLISGACEADFERNGLNDAPIPWISVWVAGQDRALALADTRAGRWLGYGTLGLEGPRNAAVPVTHVNEPDYDHGDWFLPENFTRTMEIITAQER